MCLRKIILCIKLCDQDTISHPLGRLLREQNEMSVGRGGETGTLVHCWWEREKVPHCGSPALPQKVKGNYHMIQQMPERTENRNSDPLYTNVHSSITINKSWEQPKSPSVDERTNKTWYMDTMEQYSAIKRNKFLIHVTT